MKTKYKVKIEAKNPETHRFQISIECVDTAEFPASLTFPVWTPGSYLVREYSRHITNFFGGKKISKNIWKISPHTKKITYEVYAFEKTVRTSFLDKNYAVIVGATLLPLLQDSFALEMEFPKQWNFIASDLMFKKIKPGIWKSQVRDDDHWIDSPILAASPDFGFASSFHSKGKKHTIAWVGTECSRASKELIRDCKKISDTVQTMFGGAPFKSYTYLFHFGAKLYGGLEHRSSQLSQFDGSLLHEKKEYDHFLRLVAHEYFHAWNVKSIRPEALGPFDYNKENYTEDLWFAEGLTDYFDDMIPLYAGLINEKQYWQARLKDIQLLPDGTPAQKRRSVAESSFDAWIRYYRGDEDSINTDVSYYTKGAILAWCWDAHLQKKSKRKWTLEKLLRAIWKEFGIDAYENLASAKAGFTREELFQFAEKITKIPQGKLIESYVTGRKALPWRNAAKFFEVKFKEKINNPTLSRFGMEIKWQGNTAHVSKVLAGSSAELAGISVNDEIIAIETDRINDSTRYPQILNKYSNKIVKFTLARGEKILQTKILAKKHPNIGIEFELI